MEAANFDSNKLNPEFIHQHAFFALYLTQTDISKLNKLKPIISFEYDLRNQGAFSPHETHLTIT